VPVVLHEIGQDLEGFGPQKHLLSTARQHPALKVECELPERILAPGSIPRKWLTSAQAASLQSLAEDLMNI
jgi:hypothetical protein